MNDNIITQEEKRNTYQRISSTKATSSILYYCTVIDVIIPLPLCKRPIIESLQLYPLLSPQYQTTKKRYIKKITYPLDVIPNASTLATAHKAAAATTQTDFMLL